MQIRINSDHQLNPSPQMAGRIQARVRDTLDRFSDRITRVEIHLNDENSVKGGNDKRCLMEARVAGLGPVDAEHEAPDLDLAVDGAIEKLERALEHRIGKVSVSGGRRSGKGGV